VAGFGSGDQRSATLDGFLEPDPINLVAENVRA